LPILELVTALNAVGLDDPAADLGRSDGPPSEAPNPTSHLRCPWNLKTIPDRFERGLEPVIIKPPRHIGNESNALGYEWVDQSSLARCTAESRRQATKLLRVPMANGPMAAHVAQVAEAEGDKEAHHRGTSFFLARCCLVWMYSHFLQHL
jgi:hypothetical protein